MYKVVLVDDDYIVLEYLTKMIPWEALGFSIIGSFQDGKKALDQLELEMADLVITDIGMPVMDGISLLRYSKELNPNLFSIILSCHDDFQYAQQAIKLDTFEYILKESMDANNITKLLAELKVKMDIEKSKRYQMDKLEEEKHKYFKRNLINSLIEGEIIDQELSELGINITTCIPVFCFIDQFQKVDHHSNEILKRKIEQILSKADISLHLFIRNPCLLCFIILLRH
ncbi:response regulator [Oceanobacillus sp. 143]|nr:response regulator [Oceanobacillus sp. 143]